MIYIGDRSAKVNTNLEDFKFCKLLTTDFVFHF